MKKNIVLTVAILFMAITATFASPANPVPQSIISKWQQDFKNANGSSWKKVDKYYKASFTINNQLMEAFYDSKGTLTGTSRYITVSQLPLALSKEVYNKKAEFQISEIFELLTDKGTEYFITYNNKDSKLVYKSYGNYWTRYTRSMAEEGL